MNPIAIHLSGTELTPLPSGGLWWSSERVLCVSDLHFGKSERIARRGGTMLPPYETRETLERIAFDLDLTGAQTVICLGDSFDDSAAGAALDPTDQEQIARLQEGRRWVWIEGNHDRGPVGAGGIHAPELALGPLLFRHIAQDGAEGEISGHYHPKAELCSRGVRLSRRCFLFDTRRIVMPAYGTYTGGLRWTAPELRRLFAPDACAALLGEKVHFLPVPA